MTFILNIITLICSISSISLSILVIRQTNKLKKGSNKKQKDKKENESYEEEYLYSLEFNTKLDGLIQPLLGKYANDQIVEKLLNELYDKDEKVQKLSLSKVEIHIRDILLNYNNSYIEENPDNDYVHTTLLYGHNKLEYKGFPTQDIIVLSPLEEDIQKPVKETKSKTIDLTNTLNNFYKD